MDLFFLETFKVKHNEENDIEIKEIKEDNDLYFNDGPRIEFFFQDMENSIFLDPIEYRDINNYLMLINKLKMVIKEEMIEINFKIQGDMYLMEDLNRLMELTKILKENYHNL